MAGAFTGRVVPGTATLPSSEMSHIGTSVERSMPCLEASLTFLGERRKALQAKREYALYVTQ